MHQKYESAKHVQTGSTFLRELAAPCHLIRALSEWPVTRTMAEE
jgi:hypothetical protein